MTKTIKIVLFVFIIFSLFMPNQSYASSFGGIDTIKKQADDWISSGSSGEAKISDNKIAEILLPIGRFLVAVGTIAVVGALIILGIKYMSAADPGTQAKVKQQLIGLVVAAVIIFGAVGIWTLVYNTMESVVGH